MQRYDSGVCHFCGQTQLLDSPAASQEDADRLAKLNCDCPKATEEQRTLQKIEAGCDRVRQLFGPAAEELNMRPVDGQDQELISLLCALVETAARHQITSVTMQTWKYGRAKVGMTGKGRIRVERAETTSYQLED